MTGAMVIRWGESVPGRETKGLETFTKALAHFEGLAKQGRIHGHKEYLSLTGKTGGFMIIEGQIDELLKIQTEEATVRLITESQLITDGFEVQAYVGGSEATLQQMMGMYGETLQQMGFTG